jgi:hypothetical protein
VEYDAAADELYSVLPSEFTAARKRLAGELPRDDARRLTGLRRPTVPAWAVNLLVRDGSVDPLLDLGARMREAWSTGGDLAALDRERVSLVDDLVRRARALADEAGRPLSDAFADEVEQTLRAAIADTEAAEAVRAGRLDHPLRYAGFGPFGASAPPPARPKPPPRREKKKKPDEEEERRRRREQARAAERAAEEAERSLAEWASTLEEARRRLAEADGELEALRERVRDAEARHADLDRRVRVTAREHERAERAAKQARRRAGDLA